MLYNFITLRLKLIKYSLFTVFTAVTEQPVLEIQTATCIHQFHACSSNVPKEWSKFAPVCILHHNKGHFFYLPPSPLTTYNTIPSILLFPLPWYNHNGWLGIKHQLTYLLTTLSPKPNVSYNMVDVWSVSPVVCWLHWAPEWCKWSLDPDTAGHRNTLETSVHAPPKGYPPAPSSSDPRHRRSTAHSQHNLTWKYR